MKALFHIFSLFGMTICVVTLLAFVFIAIVDFRWSDLLFIIAFMVGTYVHYVGYKNVDDIW